MKLIVGLGNPGPEYALTRHNAGFLAVQALAEAHRIPLTKRLTLGRRLVARWGEWRMSTACAVRLLLPQTMMNLSGDALRAVSTWDASAPETLVVCDDVHLPLGQLRLRPKGGAGGQHGLASCLEALGTDEVPRLRIGIGAEPLPRDLTEFVLYPFEPSEQPGLRRALAQAVEACERWAAEGIDVAMNQVNAA